jgi:ATP-binding cassette subfamily F protein 3
MNRSTGSKTQATDSKLQWEERKNREKLLRKLRTQIEKSESEIAKLEKEITEFDTMLADPARYKNILNDADAYKRYNALKATLEMEMERWEKLHMELERENSQ